MWYAPNYKSYTFWMKKEYMKTEYSINYKRKRMYIYKTKKEKNVQNKETKKTTKPLQNIYNI